VPIHGAGLRTDGVYRRVRHPIYSAVLLLVLGFVVALGSIWSVIWAVLIVVFFVLKSRWEDGLLREEYDEQWSAWAARTGAIIPRIGQRSA
jgi:protein-S-isoprenylcysteine O-methyltransferase Ste14